MKKPVLFTVLLIYAAFSYNYESNSLSLKMAYGNDTSKFTNTGSIGLRVSNFGVFGSGFIEWWAPDKPSCEYPSGSRIEHIYVGGLWIGGFISNDSAGTVLDGPYVSTGAFNVPNYTGSNGANFEFTTDPEDTVIELSCNPASHHFSAAAISDQDFVANYADSNRTVPGSGGVLIPHHNPLGLVVHQSSYAWNYPLVDCFVIMNYWLINKSHRYLKDIYVSLWADAVVHNINVVPPIIGAPFYRTVGVGHNSSLNLAYAFNADTALDTTGSYLGMKFLGSSPRIDTSRFVSWLFSSSIDSNFTPPSDDPQRYERMEGFFAGTNTYGNGINPDTLKLPDNRSILISSGPFELIPPGDSINVVFAITCARKTGPESGYLDTEEQKSQLYDHADWAQKTYNGEDLNGNGILDPGEDLNNNGKIDRYIFWPYLTICGTVDRGISGYSLFQNYPNPFNPVTNIQFSLPKTSHVVVEVFNTLGQRVAILVDKKKPAGCHTVQFDSRNFSSGLYFYKIQAGSYSQVRKMLLVK